MRKHAVRRVAMAAVAAIGITVGAATAADAADRWSTQAGSKWGIENLIEAGRSWANHGSVEATKFVPPGTRSAVAAAQDGVSVAGAKVW